jgi:hypothetical protein
MILYRRRWTVLYFPVLLLAAVLTLMAVRDWFPLPPLSLNLSSPSPSAGFEPLAERYRDELERRHGIKVGLTNNDTIARSMLTRLIDPQDPLDATFAAGLLSSMPLTTASINGPQVQALAVVGRHPVWVFTSLPNITHLNQLRGKRIGAGPADSMTREAAVLLLSQAQVPEAEVVWHKDLAALPAADAMFRGQLDAVFVIAGTTSSVFQVLSRAQGIYMVGVERANGLASREPRLRATVLPQGAIELRGDIPPRDTTLLYTHNHLVVRSDLHPALQRALLDTAVEVHGVRSPLQQQDEYPDFLNIDFPLSPQAQRYAQGWRPWMEQALPYWWAQLAELLLYGVLPILVLAGLALVWIPRLFSVRVDAVLAHYYGELKFLEYDLQEVVADKPMAIKGLLAKLDLLDKQVSALDLPDRYADRWYTLRIQLAAARDKLMNLRSR